MLSSSETTFGAKSYFLYKLHISFIGLIISQIFQGLSYYAGYLISRYSWLLRIVETTNAWTRPCSPSPSGSGTSTAPSTPSCTRCVMPISRRLSRECWDLKVQDQLIKSFLMEFNIITKLQMVPMATLVTYPPKEFDVNEKILVFQYNKFMNVFLM